MSDQLEISDFDESEAELERQIAELNRKKIELRLAKEKALKDIELSKPVAVTVVSHNGATVKMKNDPYREDVLIEFQKTPSRMWNAWGKENSIAIKDLPDLITRLKALNKVSVFYNKGVEDSINEYLTAPDFKVVMQDLWFTVKPGPNNPNTYGLRDLPGADYNYEKQVYKVPLSEGYKLFEYFEKRESENLMVVWDEKALEFVSDQIKKRGQLDKIALAEDADVVVEGFIGELRPFQKVGVKYFELNGGRGILSDEMGLGKTPQAIAIGLQTDGMVLCVVPASLKINWAREIVKFTGHVPYVLSGTTPTAYDVSYLIAKKPKFTIINYDIIRSKAEWDEETTDEEGFKHKKHHKKWPWVEVLNLVGFKKIFLDEAHYIKNSDSSQSQACRQLQGSGVICMTGTPVLNRPGELWPMLNLISPDMFPAEETFIRQYTWNGKEARNIDELRAVLRPIMIRRLKSNVIKELPLINRITEYQEASPKAKKLYGKVLAGVYDSVSQLTGENYSQAVPNILVQIMRCKQILAIDKVESTTDRATEIFYSTDPTERAKKVLIFSQFKAVAYAIKQRLGHDAIGFVDWSEESKEFKTVDNDERQRRVDKFQNDPDVHYLVVTEKTAKEGHNITAAMAVIFNDLFWTPAAHQQGEGRAYGRLSDLHPIDAYYRVGVIEGEEESMDEMIMSLLDNKLKMIGEVVEGVNQSRNADESIANDLIEKIKERMWRKK